MQEILIQYYFLEYKNVNNIKATNNEVWNEK